MEHQTMTTIAGFDFGIVAHELAHSWFGDYLTCASWQDIWINEGFASYAEFIAIDALKSHADAVKWLSQAQNFAINYPFDGVFLTPEESRNVQRIFSSGLSYKKGGAIIHMLRYEINNDSLFFTIIRDYVKSFANSNATGQDFQNIVEKHTGEDFNWFFDQWYYGKGYPVFVTNWRQVGDSLILTSSQSSSTGNAEFFKTHMDYRIHYLSGKISDFRVFYENSDETFRIKVTEEVNSIQIDPESNVLKNAAVYKYTDLTKVFLVSPNPFKNELNIAFRNSTKPREIVLSGITGKVFLSQTVTAGSLTLDLSFLKQGIYLLQVTEDGIKYTEKVIRQ
jgi:aminopeptidase N